MKGLILILVPWVIGCQELEELFQPERERGPGLPAQLAFRTVEAPTAQQNFFVEVEIQDAAGRLVPNATAEVTISLIENPGSMILHASGSVDPVDPTSGATDAVLELVDPVTRTVAAELRRDDIYEEVTGMTLDVRSQEHVLVVTGKTGVASLVLYDLWGGETVIGATGVDLGGLTFSGSPAEPGVLYGVGHYTPDLYVIAPASGVVVSQGPLTLPGDSISGFEGLATDPTDGTMFAIVTVDRFFNYEKHLARVDPTTRRLTDIGRVDQRMADITFMPDGTLMGVTGGDVRSGGERLYTIDKQNAVSAWVMALGNGLGGEAITSVPARLYGVLARVASRGVAAFNVQIDAPATGYVLGAEADGLQAAVSAPFDVTP